MLFDLNDEQKAIRDSVAGALQQHASAADVLKLSDAGALDPTLWSVLTAMGLCGVMANEKSGGLGLDFLTLTVIAETLGAYATPAPVAATALAAWTVEQSSDQAVAAKWAPQLASGNKVAAFAVCEGAGQWRPEQWRGDGSRLTLERPHVEWASRADVFLVGTGGGKLLLVERDAGGVDVVGEDGLDRTRQLARLSLRDTPCIDLGLCPEDVDRVFDALVLLQAADAVGVANRALEMAVEYAKTRVQFDQPIGKFQALKHQLANVAVEVEPCRPLLWRGAHVWEHEPAERGRTTALVKAHITDIAVRAARQAVEAHGGIGYTWEYPLHLWLKRAMHDATTYGRPAAHRARYAALSRW